MYTYVQELQISIGDHEPEFTSLKKEAQELCRGPDSEPDYLRALCEEKSGQDAAISGQDDVRPGQEKLESVLSDMERQLEELKRRLADYLKSLTRQLSRAEEFQDVLSRLLSWLGQAAAEAGGLKVSSPKSSSLQPKLKRCKVNIL